MRRGDVSGGVGEEGLLARTDAPWTAASRDTGLRALGRVYAGWGLSQAFYRERLYETALGFAGLEDFLKRFWEGWALSKGRSSSSSSSYARG